MGIARFTGTYAHDEKKGSLRGLLPAYARCALRDVLAPLLGMSMFWPLLRYSSLVMVLYPHESGMSLPSDHALFLLVLAAIFAVLLANQRAVSRILATRRLAVLAAGALCSLASAGLLETGVPRPATMPFVATGLVVLFAAWALWCSSDFSMRTIAVVCGSFFFSYVLFSLDGVIGAIDQGRFACTIMPVGSAALWACSRPLPDSSDRPMSLRGLASPFMLLVVAFLVIGAAVRGIADLQLTGHAPRVLASLIASGCAFAFSLACLVMPASGASDKCVRRPATTWFVLMLLVVLSLFFLGALFAFFLGGDGDLVVVARTILEPALWFILCACVTSRELLPVPVFLLVGMGTDVVSWLVSYVLVPVVVGPGSQSALSGQTLVLAIIFALASVGIVAAVVALAVSDRGSLPWPIEPGADQASPSQVAAEGNAPGAGGEGARLASSRLAVLSERERSVVALYAQGYSLVRVAERLGITRSTAQSHIKAAYRKLDVHTRDELIERVRG